jgi:hypothetical protein
VFVLLGEVAVWRLADVPALTGVFLEAVPRLLQHLDHVPLGHALFGAAQENLSGAFAAVRLRDRLVGGQQGHPGEFEVVLDLGALVGPPGDAVDRLADDDIEAAIR